MNKILVSLTKKQRDSIISMLKTAKYEWQKIDKEHGVNNSYESVDGYIDSLQNDIKPKLIAKIEANRIDNPDTISEGFNHDLDGIIALIKEI